MGAVAGDTHAFKDELPRRRVQVPTFYMDRYEVSRAQFRAFMKATGYVSEATRSAQGWGFGGHGDQAPEKMIKDLTWEHPAALFPGVEDPDRHPVTCITWGDAMAYSSWVGATLPTEKQFEFVLRNGGDSHIYPWGDTALPPSSYANLSGDERTSAYPHAGSQNLEGYSDPFIGTAPVGVFPETSLGLFDVCGNVSEWCLSEHVPYDEVLPSHSASGDADSIGVARGGNFASRRIWLRSSCRHEARRGVVRVYLGFRCVRVP